MKPYVFLRFELSDPKTQHLVGLITESIQVGTVAMGEHICVHIGGELEVLVRPPLDTLHSARMDWMEQTEGGEEEDPSVIRC